MPNQVDELLQQLPVEETPTTPKMDAADQLLKDAGIESIAQKEYKKENAPFSSSSVGKALKYFNAIVNPSNVGDTKEAVQKTKGYFHAFDNGVSDFATKTIPQLMSKIGEDLGIVADGTTAKKTASMNEEIAARSKYLSDNYPLDPSTQQGFYQAGGTAAGVGATLPIGMGVGAAAGKAAMAGAGAIQGGLQSMAQYDPTGKANLAVQAAPGAVVGGGIGALMGAAGKLAGTNTAFGQQGKQIADTTGVDLSLGQQTGNPSYLRGEVLTGDARIAQINKANKQAIKYVWEKADKIGSHLGENIGSQIDDLHTKVIATGDQMRVAAGYQFKQEIAKAKLTGTSIPTPNLMKTVADQLDELTQGATSGSTANAAIAKELKIIKAGLMRRGTPSLSVEDIIADNAAYNNWAKPSLNTSSGFSDVSNTKQRLGTILKGAMRQDVDDSINAGSTSSPILKSAWNNYNQAMEKIEGLKGSVLAKIFGKEDGPIPEQFITKLPKMSPSVVQKIGSQIKELDPLAWENMQKATIWNALKGSEDVTKAPTDATIRYNTKQFLKWFESPQVKAMFYDKPDVLAQMVPGVQAMERINLSKVGEVMSPETAYQAAKQFISKGVMSKVMYSPTFRSSMESLASQDPAAITAGVMAVSPFIQSEGNNVNTSD